MRVAWSLLNALRMEVSLYSAAAAMNATEKWQDLVADNLSSASLPGARQQEISFSAVQAGMMSGAPGSATGSFVIPFAGASTNFSQGELKATGGSMDFAVEGPGFFSMKMPDGTKAYTRDGEFKVNAQGVLSTKQGYPVDGTTGPIKIDSSNPAPLSVSADGQVSQGADVKGTIAVTEFGNMKGLGMGNGGFFYADPAVALPKPAATTSVRQGFVEASNTSPTLAMASLISSMRMFETNQKVMQMQSDRMTKTITDLSGTGS
jgi:flagellar basal body rod protein FlgG